MRLGDAAGFARRHLAGADGVEQGGLAVVDVAHDGDHGRAPELLADRFGTFLGVDLHVLFEGHDIGQVAEFPGDLLGQFGVQGLVDGGEHAPVQQLGHHVLGRAVALFGQFLHRDAFGQHDDADLVVDVFSGDLLGARARLAELELQFLGHAFGAGALVVLLLAGEVPGAAGALLGVGIGGGVGGQGRAAPVHAGAAGPRAGSAGTAGAAAGAAGTAGPAGTAGTAAGAAGAARAAAGTVRAVGPGDRGPGLGQLDVAGRFRGAGRRRRGVRHLDPGEPGVGAQFGDGGRNERPAAGLSRDRLMLDRALAGVGGHGQEGLFRLGLARALDLGLLPGALDDRPGAGLGPNLGGHLLGQLDVAGRLLGLGRRHGRLRDAQPGEAIRGPPEHGRGGIPGG